MSGKTNNIDKEPYHCLVCNEKFTDLDSYTSHKEGSVKDFFACKKWNSTSTVEEDVNNYLGNSNSPQLVEIEEQNTLLKNYNSPQLVEKEDLNNLLKNYNSSQLVEEEDPNTLVENYITPHSDITPVKIDINYNEKQNLQRSLSLSDTCSKLTTLNSGHKQFKCDKCDKAFSDKYNLRCHLRTHSVDKSFQCDQCDKAFSQKKN